MRYALIIGVASALALGLVSRASALTASFAYSPQSPRVGDVVVFNSTTTVRQGATPVIKYEWDLDGDGVFGERGEPAGAGAKGASRSFPRPGNSVVRLRITDATGAQDVAERTVSVAAGEGPPRPTPCPRNVACFDDLPSGTIVKSQYKEAGVEFGFTQIDSAGTSGVLPIVGAHPLARSKEHIARTPGCARDFCPNTVYGRFAAPRRFIRVYVGGDAEVALVALTATGKQIGKVTREAGSGASTELRIVDRKGLGIAYFQIGETTPPGADQATLSIDDLGFSAAGSHATPDFALSWTPPFPGQTALVAPVGGSVSTQVHITRLNGFSGDVAVSSDTVPAGFSAAALPATATATAGFVAVKITAPNTFPSGVQANVLMQGRSIISGTSIKRTVTIRIETRLSDFDVLVKGVEVTQGIQVQAEPYYTGGGPDPAFCSVAASVSAVCTATLFAPAICSSSPSLAPRDMSNLTKPISYRSLGSPLLSLSPLSVFLGVDLTLGRGTQVAGGVRLVSGEKTVARVYASLLSPTGGSLADVPAALYGRRKGKPLPGSPLSPDEGVRNLGFSQFPWTTCAERGDPQGAYTFTLPASWTKGKVELRAQVLPEQITFGAGGECGSATCMTNNELRLVDVDFEPLSYVTVTPVFLSLGQTPSDPEDVFKRFFDLLPGAGDYVASGPETYAANLHVYEELATIAGLTSAETCSFIREQVEDWASENTHGDLTVGVLAKNSICPGQSSGSAHLIGPGSASAYSVVAPGAPLKSVAHELFHGMGRRHADTACGGNSNGQVGESWPPEQRGHIHGIGLDTNAVSIGPYPVVIPGGVLGAGSPQPNEWVDFMSYCGSDAGSWISDRGWDLTVGLLERFQKAMGRLGGGVSAYASSPAGDSAVEPALEVTALVRENGELLILRTEPGKTRARAGHASRYRLIARGSSGQLLSDTPMRFSPSHMHSATSVGILTGQAPQERAARVEIVFDGRVVASRSRSSRPPEIRVIEPRSGVVGRTATVVVRWAAVDADGDALSAKIDYSIDGGRTWRSVAGGLNGERAKVPSRLFWASSRARVRVRVSDRFNESTAVSQIFRALGRPPSLEITSPTRGRRISADSLVHLAVDAHDERGRRIADRRLLWSVGNRRLGTGAKLAITGLTAGLHTIRVQAGDGRGRRTTSSVTVRIQPAAPHLLALRLPKRQPAAATRLVVAIATTAPAILHVGGRSVRVDRILRRVSLPVKRGRGMLRVSARLSAAGKTTRLKFVVERHTQAYPQPIRK